MEERGLVQGLAGFSLLRLDVDVQGGLRVHDDDAHVRKSGKQMLFCCGEGDLMILSIIVAPQQLILTWMLFDIRLFNFRRERGIKVEIFKSKLKSKKLQELKTNLRY
jgi:hypothetical protein